MIRLSIAACVVMLPMASLSADEQDAGGQPRREAPRPAYRIGIGDVLLIDSIKVLPKEPYRIEPLDVLRISVAGALVDRPIEGDYVVGAGGNVDLGPPYGLVQVVGNTTEEATDAIRAAIAGILQKPLVSLSLAAPAAMQQIAGEHVVLPDGHVVLGVYGSVDVLDLTIAEAREAIEEHLQDYLQDPRVSVDLFESNSKFYYVVQRVDEQQSQVRRYAHDGNVRVLDALAQSGVIVLCDEVRPRVDEDRPRFRERLVLIRPSENGERSNIDVRPLLEGEQDSNPRIEPGDLLLVQ